MESPTRAYLSRLDHLRFLAALQVLVWHSSHYRGELVPTSYVPTVWPASLLEEGHTGVALFMTLSGFVFHTLGRGHRIAYGSFVRNRALRILPLFFVWTLLLFYEKGVDPVKLFVAVAGLLNHDTVPGVGWTIVVEFQFYLAFPFLLAFMQRFGPKYVLQLLGLAIFARACLWYSDGTVHDIAYSTIFGRIDQFLLGMLASELYARRAQFRLLASPLFLLAIFVGWSALYHQFNAAGGYYHIVKAPSPSPVWIALPTAEGLFYGLFTASYLSQGWSLPKPLDRALAWVGTLSFSLYLNHVMVLEVAFKGLKAVGVLPVTTFPAASAFALLVVLPLTIVVSAVTYAVIEKPFLAMRSNYLLPLEPEAGERARR